MQVSKVTIVGNLKSPKILRSETHRKISVPRILIHII